MTFLDRRVILSGTLSGLFFALPAAVLQRTVFDAGPARALMVFVVFFAGALAGYAAARPRPERALQHGAAAGVLTFVGAQLVYIIASRSFSNPLGIIAFALVFASLGTIGAWVAVSSPRNRT